MARPITTGTTPPAVRKARSLKALAEAGGREIRGVRLPTPADVDNLALLRWLLPGSRDAGSTVRNALIWAATDAARHLTPEMRARAIAEGRAALWPDE